MKNALLACALLLTTITAYAQELFIGKWHGAMDVGQELKIGFNISKNESGAYIATLDVPSQNVKGMACSDVTVKDNDITIKMTMLNGKFTGNLKSANTIAGTWTQNGMDLPLDLSRSDKEIELVRPQTPKDPLPYNSEDIIYYSENKSIEYGATITYPKDGKQHAAILLITGSGPQNRDEEIFGHKPFAVVADYLTRKGYVVMRVDDRGVGKTTGKHTGATSADFARDANLALDYLKKKKYVDKSKLGIWGHSEGGAIAPIVANQRKDIDFLILMAAPGVKVTELMTEQNEALLKSSGMPDEYVKAYVALYKDIVTILVDSKTQPEAAKKMHELMHEWRGKTDSAVVVKITGITDEYTETRFSNEFLKLMEDPWMMYFLRYDPQLELKNLSAKVLALNGDKDVQVISKTNLQGIEASLKESKSKVYNLHEIKGVNHLFQECKTCTVLEYGQLEQTIKPAVLDIVGAWLDKNVK